MHPGNTGWPGRVPRPGHPRGEGNRVSRAEGALPATERTFDMTITPSGPSANPVPLAVPCRRHRLLVGGVTRIRGGRRGCAAPGRRHRLAPAAHPEAVMTVRMRTGDAEIVPRPTDQCPPVM